jgi:hypothetical protein
VVLEVSHLKSLTIDLLYSFIEIWLRGHCKKPWHLEQYEEREPLGRRPKIYIRIEFQDLNEAMIFKLSPNFLHNQPTVKSRVNETSAMLASFFKLAIG